MKKPILFLLLSLISFSTFSQTTSNTMSRALAEMQERNFKEAIVQFDEVIRLDDKNIQAYTNRGFARAQLQDYDRAILDFSKIIELEPNNAYAYDKRGICKKNAGDYQGALKDYNKAIELESENAPAYYNRGVVKYDFLNDKIGACEDWTISKNLDFERAINIYKERCEEREIGVFPTKNGLLIYFNVENNYHTLNLDGDIDLSNFPIIRKDDQWFQFNINDKDEFVDSKENVLINYMNWEIDYFEEEFETKLQSENKIISVNGIQVNLWNYKNPKMDTQPEHTPVIKTYFADFAHNDLIYSLVYASTTDNNESANEFLKSLVSNIRFYKNKIDLDKLQEAIKNGINFYAEE
ncbi:MAG TPA: tetratricopeptide repeat protein [Chitinophagales bacterium]|nr:tetratricopeptide repeat protein [Chitinophagales bacterium]